MTSKSSGGDGLLFKKSNKNAITRADSGYIMHRLEKENNNLSQRVKFEHDGGYSRESIR